MQTRAGPSNGRRRSIVLATGDDQLGPISGGPGVARVAMEVMQGRVLPRGRGGMQIQTLARGFNSSSLLVIEDLVTGYMERTFREKLLILEELSKGDQPSHGERGWGGLRSISSQRGY
jgi:hypothetical protein